MNDLTAWKVAGAWLRELRLAAEITQRELAEQVGAPDASWIAEIEAGRRPAPIAFYKGYARAFAILAGAFAARCAEAYGLAGQEIDAAA